MHLFQSRLILLFIVLFLLFSFTTNSTLFAAPVETVTNTGDAGPGSLRQAIADADPGGEVVFNLPGVGPYTIFLASRLRVDKPLTITGPGRDLLVLNAGGGNFQIFSISDSIDSTKNEVVISGLTADGGFSTSSGILNFDNLTLNNVLITRTSTGIITVGAFFPGNSGASLALNKSEISFVANVALFVFPGQAPSTQGGNVTILNSSITNNGDGVVNAGSTDDFAAGSKVFVNKSTIAGNGQGIVNEGAGAEGAIGGTVEVSNSTISNNSGDGIQTNGGTNGGTGGTTRVSSSTIAGNGFRGTINFGTDPVTEAKNSIIVDNTVEDCGILDGVFTALGVNFNTDGTCTGFTTVSSLQLNLSPLQNNGGPTETHALIPPSSAIDVVTDCTFIDGAPVLEDQRGLFRPETICDAGAFEFGATLFVVRNVPTMSQWGVILTVVLLGLAMIYFYSRNKKLT